MSKTPRTDEAEAEQRKVFFVGGRVLADFARELELESAALREALERRHAEQSYPMPDYVRDVLKAKGAKS